MAIMQPNIMLVDDNLFALEMMAAEASEFADVVCCHEAHEARERLKWDLYDLIIVDMELPHAEGLALVHEVLNNHPSLRAMVLATVESSATRAVAIRKVPILFRPFSMIRFVEEVRSALKRQPSGNSSRKRSHQTR